MKLLLDTNILLDCMMDRQPFAADVRKLLILGALGEVDLWMSPSQFADAFYLLTEGGKPCLAEAVKFRLLKVKRLARICTLGEYDTRTLWNRRGPISKTPVSTSVPRGCSVEAIITRNQADFERLDHSRLRLRRVLRPPQGRSWVSCTRRLTGRMLWLAVQTLRCTF